MAIATMVDTPIRLLAIVVVFVLMVLLAAVSVSRRRGERMERKLDAIAQALGIGELMAQIDEEYGRRTGYASLIEHDLTGRTGAAPLGRE